MEWIISYFIVLFIFLSIYSYCVTVLHIGESFKSLKSFQKLARIITDINFVLICSFLLIMCMIIIKNSLIR